MWNSNSVKRIVVIYDISQFFLSKYKLIFNIAPAGTAILLRVIKVKFFF